MSRLDQFLTVASEEIEADLARYYPQIRLEELHKKRGLTHRKLMILLDRLPMESCWKTWIRDNVPVKEPEEQNSDTDFSGQRWDLLNFQIQGLRNDLYRIWAQGEVNQEFVPPYEVPLPKRGEQEVVSEQSDQRVISLDEQRARLAEVRANRGARPGNWSRTTWSPDRE